MSDSSGEEFFQAKKPQKREFMNQNQPPLVRISQPAVDDEDDGFNQEEAQQLFNNQPAAEPEKLVQRDSNSREATKSKKLKRMRRRQKDDDEDSYRGRNDEDEEQPTQKVKRQKPIKKNDAPRKRAPPKSRQESTKDIERRQMQDQCRGIAMRLIEEMNRCYETDKHNIEIKKQALQKLQYLSQVSSKLENKYVQYFFLEEDGLQALEKWIKKYPNGEDPSYSVRRRVLEIILSLPTKSGHISKSQELAALIEKLKKTTNHSLTQLKILSEKIVFKWQSICNFDERERIV